MLCERFGLEQSDFDELLMAAGIERSKAKASRWEMQIRDARSEARQGARVFKERLLLGMHQLRYALPAPRAAQRLPLHERAHIHGLALLHPAHAHSNTLLPSASRQARAQHPHAPASSSLRAQVRRVR